MVAIPTGRFVWFEYVAKDAAKAQGFFGELFGWKTQSMPTPDGGTYTMITLGDQPIGGYLPPPAGAPAQAHWLSHLQVADAVAVAAKISALGGKVRMPPVPMGGMGTMGVVADPGDATFALWQPLKAEGSSDYKGVDGAWCWNELMTDDPDRALAFYQAIGGFETEAMDMGGSGPYHVLKSDGKGRAGVVKKMMAEAPTAWLPYIQVASADQTAERAKRLGADLKVPPTDIPNVGRFSIFTDSQGAGLGILQPQRG